MASTRKSVVFSALSNFGTLAVSAILLIVVTRWLDPVEIGAFAVAYAVIAILEPLRQFKIIQFVIQARSLNDSTMGAVQLVGWLVTIPVVALCVGVGFWMQAGFDSPLAGHLLLMMTATLISKAISQPAHAHLSRNMRFDVIASLKVAGAALKGVVTISLLMAGFRAEALAFGIIAEVGVELVMIAFVSRSAAFPRPRLQGVKPIWQYCYKASGAQLMNRGANSAADLVVGSFLGLAAAGLFNRANVLVKMFRSGVEQAVFPVATAVFARSDREHRSHARAAYLRALHLLTGLSWSALCVFIVLAEPLILLAYGARWASIVPVAQILAISGIIYSATAFSQTLLGSIGAVDALLKREIFIQVPRLVILLVSARFSIIAVAWGMALTTAIGLLVNEHLVGRELSLRYCDLLRALVPSGIVAICSSAPALLVLQFTPLARTEPLQQLLIAGGLAAFCWIAATLLFHRELREEALLAIAALRQRNRSQQHD